MRKWLVLLLSAVLALGLAACGGDDDDEGDGGGAAETTTQADQAGEKITSNPDNAKVRLTIGSKNFTEQKLLGEIFAQGLQAAGYTVDTELNLGDEKVALKSLQDGDIDGYPEYTGTALLSFCDVKAADIPKEEDTAFEDAKACLAKDGVAAHDPTPFTSSNEVGLTKEKADELGVEKISDLAEHDQDLTLYGSPECRQRSDCLLGLQDVYGLKFRKFTPVDIALRHEVLTKDQADLSIVFTTDPQIKREGFVLLEDDKGMFPPYNSTFLVREETVQEAGPDLDATIEKVQAPLTAEVMQELNARVDLDKKTPRAVAKEFLTEEGLI